MRYTDPDGRKTLDELRSVSRVPLSGSRLQSIGSSGNGRPLSATGGNANNNLNTSSESPSSVAAAIAGVLIADDATGVGVADDVAIPVVLVIGVLLDEAVRVHITYTLVNSSGQVYVGRSSGFGSPESIMWQRFANHDMKAKGFGNPMLDVSSQGPAGRFAIRGREQQLIDSFGGVGSPRVGNAIRGVSANNAAGRMYHNASNSYFGEIHEYTGNW